MKALIVDDDVISTKALTYQLYFLKIEILYASDIKSAEIIIESDPPSIIFLDLVLPSMGGLEFLKLRHQKLAGVTGSIPVVVISGKADLHTIREALFLGADGYLIKPVQLKMLREALKKCGLSY